MPGLSSGLKPKANTGPHAPFRSMGFAARLGKSALHQASYVLRDAPQRAGSLLSMRYSVDDIEENGSS